MMIAAQPSDSVCTSELHNAAVELKRIAGGGTARTVPNQREVFLHLASVVEHIERVSRRVDGEAAARRAIQSALAEVIDTLRGLEIVSVQQAVDLLLVLDGLT